jgi:hypothetical protein
MFFLTGLILPFHLAKAYSNKGEDIFYFNSARIVSIPLTLSSILTFTSVPIGKNISTREPNFMNPNSLP